VYTYLVRRMESNGEIWTDFCVQDKYVKVAVQLSVLENLLEQHQKNLNLRKLACFIVILLNKLQ
jgi:hypothetical protein